MAAAAEREAEARLSELTEAVAACRRAATAAEEEEATARTRLAAEVERARAALESAEGERLRTGEARARAASCLPMCRPMCVVLCCWNVGKIQWPMEGSKIAKKKYPLLAESWNRNLTRFSLRAIVGHWPQFS